MPRPHRRGGRPAGGRAAGLAALAAGLTLGLMSGGASTLLTHPGDAGAVLVPLAGAIGIMIASAFRSRAVAQRRRRHAIRGRERMRAHEQVLRPKPVLIHSRETFRPVVIATEPVATPTRRAA